MDRISDSSGLALDIAARLDRLNPTDLPGRAGLRSRLEAAGVTGALPADILTGAGRDALIAYVLGQVYSTLACDTASAQDGRWLSHHSAALVYLHDLPDPAQVLPARSVLAREVMAELDAGGFDDPARRHALAARLTAAGIRRGMHLELPARTPDPAVPDAGVQARMEDRLVEFLAWDITVAEWPTDRRIEYELGQLLIPMLIHDQAEWDRRTRHARGVLAERREALHAAANPHHRPGGTSDA